MKHIIIILLLTLPSCNQKTFTGKIYLVGYDSQWISSEKTLNFIRQQSIPEEYMKSVRYGTELIISEDKLVGVNDYNYGRRGSKNKFTSFSYPFNKLEIEKNTPYAIVSLSIYLVIYQFLKLRYNIQKDAFQIYILIQEPALSLTF